MFFYFFCFSVQLCIYSTLDTYTLQRKGREEMWGLRGWRSMGRWVKGRVVTRFRTRSRMNVFMKPTDAPQNRRTVWLCVSTGCKQLRPTRSRRKCLFGKGILTAPDQSSHSVSITIVCERRNSNLQNILLFLH